MSKFINTNQKVTIDSLVEGLKDKLNNPYYLYTDKKGTSVDYYNQNTTMSTLDEAFKQPYNLIGPQSPLRFNLIKDAFIYGISKVEITTQIGEYGLEDDAIEGDAIILPNTFVPIANDYFRINYLEDKTILFKILEVSIDTLETGANLYKIHYKLDRHSDTDIDNQVVDTFKMVLNNVGTNFKPIIKSTDYDLVKSLDDILVILKNYYKNIFYSTKVQTFIFSINGDLFYDPYMIEFIKRNKIMNGSGEFLYVEHAALVPTTFVLDYDLSFFRTVELKDKDKPNIQLNSTATRITDINSLMTVRSEPYFMIDYSNVTGNQFLSIIQNFPVDLVAKIQDGTYYDTDSEKFIWNIVIEFFNDISFKTTILDDLNSIKYTKDINLFYGIPIVIYVVECFVKSLLNNLE